MVDQIKQLQQITQQVQQRVKEIERELQKARFTTADKGVRCTIDGNGQIVEIDISESAYHKLTNIELSGVLTCLIRQSIHQASAEAKRQMEQIKAVIAKLNHTIE